MNPLKPADYVPNHDRDRDEEGTLPLTKRGDDLAVECLVHWRLCRFRFFVQAGRGSIVSVAPLPPPHGRIEHNEQFDDQVGRD